MFCELEIDPYLRLLIEVSRDLWSNVELNMLPMLPLIWGDFSVPCTLLMRGSVDAKHFRIILLVYVLGVTCLHKSTFILLKKPEITGLNQ